MTDTAPVTKISFSGTEVDFFKARRIIDKPLDTGRVVAIIAGVALGLVVVVSALPLLSSMAMWDMMGPVTRAVTFFILYLIAFPLFIKFFKRFDKRSWTDRNGHFVRPRTVTISPEGISEISECVATDCDWRAVIDIQRTEGFIMAFIDKTQAIIIPEHAFVNKAEAETFYACMQDYRDAALMNMPAKKEVPDEKAIDMRGTELRNKKAEQAIAPEMTDTASATEIMLNRSEDDFIKWIQNVQNDRNENDSILEWSQLALILVVLEFAILPFVRETSLWNTGGLTQTLIVVFGFLLLFQISNHALLKLKKKQWVFENGSYVSPTTLTISKNGIRLTSDHIREECDWQAVLDIRRNDRCILAYTDKYNSYAVPVNAFDDENDVERFYRQMLKFWAAVNPEAAEAALNKSVTDDQMGTT